MRPRGEASVTSRRGLVGTLLGIPTLAVDRIAFFAERRRRARTACRPDSASRRSFASKLRSPASSWPAFPPSSRRRSRRAPVNTSGRSGAGPALATLTPGWVLLFLVGPMLAGCAVGPAYKKPSVIMPADFSEPAVGDAAAHEWKPAEPKDDALRGRWWDVFGDSELSALEEQVNVSNQSLARAEAQFRGARAAARGARADLFPTLGASVSVTRSRASENSPTAPVGVAPGARTDYQLPVDLSYEADVWGRIRRSLEASITNAQAVAADLETVRLSMHAELAIDYFQLRGFESEKRLLDSTVSAYEKALELTTNRHDQGVVSGVDVAQAQTQLDATRAQATDLELSRVQLEHAIAILVGKPPETLTISPSSDRPAPPVIPAGLPSELLERRPDVAAAERRAASANAQIGVAKAAFFPRLLLDASGGYQSSKLSSWFSLPSRFWSLGPSLVATVFDGGKRRAATEQAQAAYDAAVAGYREQVLTALQEVEDNLAATRSLVQEADQQDAAVQAAERSLKLANSRYEGGITTYLEVITAQSAALANERTAEDILTRRMTASVLLIKALGGGWRDSDLPIARSIVSKSLSGPTSDGRPIAGDQRGKP